MPSTHTALRLLIHWARGAAHLVTPFSRVLASYVELTDWAALPGALKWLTQWLGIEGDGLSLSRVQEVLSACFPHCVCHAFTCCCLDEQWCNVAEQVTACSPAAHSAAATQAASERMGRAFRHMRTHELLQAHVYRHMTLHHCNTRSTQSCRR